ncbi:MAG: DUF4926 domain-containing protein [Cytophagaceae bacterium]|nr:DUF4926 domain-containing protein [Cytophagaceae bacterium]
MHKESDLVVLLTDRTAKQPGSTNRVRLHRGDVGTVAYVYESGTLFEVEFVNAAGETVAVETLSEGEIRAVDLRAAMLRVTDLAA